MKRTILTTALAALVASGPAFAQTQKDQSQAPNETQGEQMNQKESGTASAAQAGSIEFVVAQKETDWFASSLIGRSVRNSEDKALGDIGDVVLDQNGEVVAVLIGVGGFLGLGGKDVAVKYSALEFKKREIKQPAGEDARENAYKRNTMPGQANPIIEEQKRKMATQTPRKDANHSDIVIVLNATYEQLESAPAFTRIGQSQAQEKTETAPAEKQDKLNTEQPQQQQ